MERFADVEISLSGHHDDTVDTASESHLGQGEDDGGGVGLHAQAEAGGEGGQPVQDQHSTLINTIISNIIRTLKDVVF